MNDIIVPGEKRHLDFAFTKFYCQRFSVFANNRIYTSAHHGGLHNHDFPQIWYCLDGNYLHQVEDQVYECAKGSVVVIPTGVFHKFRIKEGEEAEILSLSVMYDIFLNAPPHQYLNIIAALFLPPFAKELGYSTPSYLMLSRESQAVLEECTSWLALLSFNPPSAVSEADILNKLETLFSLPEFALPESYRQKAMQLAQTHLQPLTQILSFLNTHYSEKIDEESLLRMLGISRSSLYRYFTRFTGYSYTQYFQQLRLRRVYLYLEHTTYSLSYISDICGFYDTQHMSHAFKKYIGWTPRQFRIFKKERQDAHLEDKWHVVYP